MENKSPSMELDRKDATTQDVPDLPSFKAKINSLKSLFDRFESQIMNQIIQNTQTQQGLTKENEEALEVMFQDIGETCNYLRLNTKLFITKASGVKVFDDLKLASSRVTTKEPATTPPNAMEVEDPQNVVQQQGRKKTDSQLVNDEIERISRLKLKFEQVAEFLEQTRIRTAKEAKGLEKQDTDSSEVDE